MTAPATQPPEQPATGEQGGTTPPDPAATTPPATGAPGGGAGTGPSTPQLPAGGSTGATQDQPPAEPATGEQGETGTDWKAKHDDLQTASRRWEERAKTNKTGLDKVTAEKDALQQILDGFRKALDPDGASKEESPQELAARAAKERDAKDEELRQLRRERAAEKAGRTAGADVDALLDSRGFAKELGKLDPEGDDFDDNVAAAITKALTANPRLKTAPPSPARSVTEPGAAQTPPAGGQTIDQIREARRKRRGAG